MTPTANSIESILVAAVEIASEADRRAYVEQACAGDPDLKRRVEELIDNHFRAGSFLESPATDPFAATDPPAGEQPGTEIGPYKLLELIGEGGFGTVYMAEQTTPVRRKVALKILKPGMDTRQVVARFTAERQALAVMDHPSIAKVFDGGTTESGRPYFVMELVKGVPITDFCDQNQLTPRERLGLFVQVCQAVQHAHQKGVIHRDLKPRNVLVALYDDKPVPKIIDFGVAKATGAQLTEETLHTNFGAVVGTVEYMSPEQATFNQLDIDTRSDVYSLGVLLYELLTGTTPLDRRRLKDTPLLELMRIVREDDTVRPSSRLSTVEELPAIAAHRRVEPKKLRGLVRGELDWIVMKALEKDRSRRYETADALAKDVERYLADEPVQACPPSAAYRVRKFARRNKGAVIVAGLMLVALTAIAGTVGWAARDRAAREAEADREIDQALREAALHRDRADWPKMRMAIGRAEWMLAGSRSAASRDRVRTMLADLQMAERVEEIRVRSPNVMSYIGTLTDHGSLKSAIAQAFKEYGIDVIALDHHAAAERIGASAIREQLIVALDEWLWSAHTKRLDGFMAAGRPARNPVVKPAAQTAEYEHVRAVADLVVRNEWWQRIRDPAIHNDRQALAELALRPEVALLPPSAKMLLCRLLVQAGRTDKATALLYSAQQQCPDDFVLNYELALLLWQRVKPPQLLEAGSFMRTAVALRPHSAILHGSLGHILSASGRLDGAVAAYRAAMVLRPDDDQIRLALGRVQLRRGDWTEVTTDTFKTLELVKTRSSSVAAYRPSLSVRGEAYARLGQWQQATADFSEAVELSPTDSKARFMLAASLLLAGDMDGFRRTCNGTLAIVNADDDPQSAYDAVIACGLAPDAVSDLSVLVRLMEQCVAKRRDCAFYYALGLAHYRAGQYREAITRLEESKKMNPSWDRGTCLNGWVLTMAHHRLGHTDDARQCFKETMVHLDEERQAKGPSSFPQSIYAWQSCQILSREAEALFDGPSPR